MSREHLALVREASFGTPVTTPVDGTDRHYIRMGESGAYQGLMVPLVGIIQHGNGRVGPACAYSDQYQLQGSLAGEFYPAITDFLLGWGTTPINTGRTAPWVTTDATGAMPVGDLASVSAYHAVLEASTWKRRRPSGYKVGTFSLAASRQDPVWKFNASLTGIRDDTNAAGVVAEPLTAEIPDPTDSKYPCGPWLFSHLAGGLKIGTLRTMFDAVTVTFTNTLQSHAFESRYPQLINYHGREIKIGVGLYRRPTPDDLSAFRALTAHEVVLTLSNGTQTLVMDFGDNCRWTSLNDERPMDDVYMWRGELTVFRDPVAGTDFTYTYTP